MGTSGTAESNRDDCWTELREMTVKETKERHEVVERLNDQKFPVAASFSFCKQLVETVACQRRVRHKGKGWGGRDAQPRESGKCQRASPQHLLANPCRANKLPDMGTFQGEKVEYGWDVAANAEMAHAGSVRPADQNPGMCLKHKGFRRDKSPNSPASKK